MATSKGTVLITGANGGLGSAFVSQFLKSPQASPYIGLFAVRNPSTAIALQKAVSSAPDPHSHHEICPLDLSTLASVRAGAKPINDREPVVPFLPYARSFSMPQFSTPRAKPLRMASWNQILPSTTFPTSSSSSCSCRAWTRSLDAS